MFSKSTVKYFQSLQDKKFRDAEQAFMAEGPKVVNELLAEKTVKPLYVFATSDWEFSSNDGVEIVKDFELDRLSNFSKANKVVAAFQKPLAKSDFITKGKITLVLDDVQDPGNLGTIVRTADWFGVENIVCSPSCADIFSPKVVQGSMASVARVNVVYTELENWLRSQKVEKYAAVLGGTSLSNLDKLDEAILVLGNEGRGISNDIIALCEHKISIEKFGKAESLNVAMAAGILVCQMKSK